MFQLGIGNPDNTALHTEELKCMAGQNLVLDRARKGLKPLSGFSRTLLQRLPPYLLSQWQRFYQTGSD